MMFVLRVRPVSDEEMVNKQISPEHNMLTRRGLVVMTTGTSQTELLVQLITWMKINMYIGIPEVV